MGGGTPQRQVLIPDVASGSLQSSAHAYDPLLGDSKELRCKLGSTGEVNYVVDCLLLPAHFGNLFR